jgi:hypothetical protein
MSDKKNHSPEEHELTPREKMIQKDLDAMSPEDREAVQSRRGFFGKAALGAAAAGLTLAGISSEAEADDLDDLLQETEKGKEVKERIDQAEEKKEERDEEYDAERRKKDGGGLIEKKVWEGLGEATLSGIWIHLGEVSDMIGSKIYLLNKERKLTGDPRLQGEPDAVALNAIEKEITGARSLIRTGTMSVANIAAVIEAFAAIGRLNKQIRNLDISNGIVNVVTHVLVLKSIVLNKGVIGNPRLLKETVDGWAKETKVTVGLMNSAAPTPTVNSATDDDSTDARAENPTNSDTTSPVVDSTNPQPVDQPSSSSATILDPLGREIDLPEFNRRKDRRQQRENEEQEDDDLPLV